MKFKNIIVACDYSYVEGGAAKVAIQTAVALSKYTDYKIFFLAGCGEPCKELLDSNIEVVALKMPDLLGNPNKLKAFANGIYNHTAYKKIKQLLQSIDMRQTIIHIHTWTKVLSSAVFKAALEEGIPVYLTVHDYFLVCPNGGCYNYVKNKICERKPLSMDCIACNCDVRHYYHKVWRCLRQVKQNSVIQKADDVHYIFISEFEKEQLLRRMPSPKYSYMLKNLISCEMRHRVEAEKNEIFLFIGRVSEEKGIKLFCESVRKAKVKAVVIGNGKLKDTLQNEYSEIIFTGWLQKSEMLTWIKKARGLIFSSLWYEGAPLTVLEVQAYGIPCIVTNCSAAVDDIIEGVTGEIVEADSKNISDALNRFRDNEYVQELSVNTYDLFDELRGSEEHYVNELLKIFNVD